MLRDWGAKHGIPLFPDAGFESLTLCCFNNGAKPGAGRTIDAAKLQKLMKDRGILIDGGYGKIKGTTFRISNMGDETVASIHSLIGALDESMKAL
jgi:aspartate aminotransferase-like enzyme